MSRYIVYRDVFNNNYIVEYEVEGLADDIETHANAIAYKLEIEVDD